MGHKKYFYFLVASFFSRQTSKIERFYVIKNIDIDADLRFKASFMRGGDLVGHGPVLMEGPGLWALKFAIYSC